jgi:hypothetical protein
MVYRLKNTWFLGLIMILLVVGCNDFNQDDEDEEDTAPIIRRFCQTVATDPSGDVYVAGTAFGDVDDQTNIGGADFFLMKFNADGTRLWTRLYGSDGDDYFEGLAVTANGDVLLSGYTDGTLSGQTALGGFDFALIRIDGDGTVVWQKQYGTPENDYGYGVAVDGTGGVLTVGHTYGLVAETLTGSKDAVVFKFDMDGTLQWSRQLSNDEGDGATALKGVYGIAVGSDAADNVYIAGMTTGNLPDNTANGEYDLFLAKYSALGDRQWVRQYGSTAADAMRAMSVTGAGTVYLTGHTRGTLADQTAGLADVFLSTFDAGGVQRWTRQIGTTANDYGTAVAVDSSGDIHLGGYTLGALAGDQVGDSDLFVIKSDGDGTILSQRQFGSSASDTLRALHCDGSNSLYLTGSTLGDLDGVSNQSTYSFLSRTDSSGTRLWTVLF